MTGDNILDAKEEQEQIRRVKLFNIVIISVFAIIVFAALICFGIYKYSHTFTTDKWNSNTENRKKIVSDMLNKHKLVGMSEPDIIELLGDEDSEQSSFKISKEYFPPETTIVYFLGVDYMDFCWLIISLEDGVVRSYCIDVT